MKKSKLKLPKIKTVIVEFNMPTDLLNEIKSQAIKYDASYKSLIKFYLDIALKSDKAGKFTFAS